MTEIMGRGQRDLDRQRPRIRNVVRDAVRHQSDHATVKKIGRGYTKEWLEGIFLELFPSKNIVWDYHEPRGELWMMKVSF